MSIWNGTYVVDIQVMPSMDSHPIVYHYRRIFVEPKKLSHMNQVRAIVHSVTIAVCHELIAIGRNHWIHNTREDIDRYHFRIEDFANSRQYDSWFGPEFVTKDLDTDKSIYNHRLYRQVYSRNLQIYQNLSVNHFFVLLFVRCCSCCFAWILFLNYSNVVYIYIDIDININNFTYFVLVISESTKLLCKWII